MKRPPTVLKQLRKSIAQADRRGMSRYAIATGETVPTVRTAERIAHTIGYRLELIPTVA